MKKSVLQFSLKFIQGSYCMKYAVLILITGWAFFCKSMDFSLRKQYQPRVILTYHDEAVSVPVLLQELELGYEFYTPPEPYTENAFSVIIIGKEFPVDKFKEILGFIFHYYPQLRYVDYYRDTDTKSSYLLHIGASTEIAIRNKLKAWKPEDFARLQTLTTKEEIFAFIQKKNAP